MQPSAPRAAFASGNDAATAAPVEAGLAAVRDLRAQLGSMGLTDSARYEIDFRLKTKERDYEDAVLAAHGLTFDAVADDGLGDRRPAGEAVMLAVNRGASDVTVTNVAIAGFDTPSSLRTADRRRKTRSTPARLKRTSLRTRN